LGSQPGCSRPQVERTRREHLGLVFDMCHQAVEFEDIPGALGALKRAGIPVTRLQAAAAIRIPEVSRDAVAALRRFDVPIYLMKLSFLRVAVASRCPAKPRCVVRWQRLVAGKPFSRPVAVQDKSTS
jgi:hypothetical protein